MSYIPLTSKKKVINAVLIALSFIPLLLLMLAPDLHAKPSDNLNRLLSKNDAVLVIDGNDNTLFSKNADNMLIPASTLKIFTSLSAIHILGRDFRFQTEFYLDEQQNLIIKGYGDPLLISETIPQIVEQIKNQVNHINDIVLDDSYFQTPIFVPGANNNSTQPYDAPNGAISVNFNTIFFKQDSNGIYISAEPQTPLLPFVLRRIQSSSLKKGRIILLSEKDEFTLYAGHLFSHFFSQNGIETKGVIRLGRVKKEDTLILNHSSMFSFFNIISGMMRYSNNFIANQLLLTMGAKTYGPPGTLEKGIQAAQSYAESQFNIKNFQIVEGSGLSRQNRISAAMMAKILKAFEPYHVLLRQDKNEYYKTGTLNGIHTRAGYLKGDKGELIRFVVLVNTKGKSTRDIMKNIHQLVLSP